MKAAGWLEARLEGAPPELAAAVRTLVKDFGGEAAGISTRADELAVQTKERAVPDLLAAAALRGFGDVVAASISRRPSRRAALRLLAADAALTYAFEAAADLELDVVGLADRIGPLGALGSLLVSAASDESPGGRS